MRGNLRVKVVLRGNNYPMASSFINDCEKALRITKPTKTTTNGFVLLLYAQDVSERFIDPSFVQATKKQQQHFSTTEAAG